MPQTAVTAVAGVTRYADHDAYVLAVRKAGQAARAAGHLLPADTREILATADAAEVP